MLELNKIHLGDSYELIKQIPDKSVDLIIIDPPYEIHSIQGGGMLKEKRIQNMMNELNNKGLDLGINTDIFDEFIRVLKVPNIYIWCNKIQLPMYLNEFVNKRGLLFDIIVWNKTNAMPLCGSKYLTDSEYCLYFRKGVKLNTTYDTAKTVYQLPINIDDKNKYDHPTIKPLQIVKNLIINSSNKNDVVLDCFMGSGTTAVASKELGRQYLGIEIDEKWHKIAVDRVNGINARGEISIFADFEKLEL
jgi:site-specific DNA-methyltransferase (adenine-specific)